MLSIAMVASSLLPAIPAYAEENTAQTGIEAEDQAYADTADTMTEDESSAGSVEEAITGKEEAVIAGSETESVEEADDTADDILAADEKSSELTLSVRKIDLMYGENTGNKDGHLDRLFAPVVKDADKAYELKTDRSDADALTFETEYKFIEDKEVFDPEDEEFAGLDASEKKAKFDALTEADILKANAGSSLYAVIMAQTSDDLTAYTVMKVNIIKRPVDIEIAADKLKVSKDSYPEDGVLTITPDPDMISVIPVTEYVINENGSELKIEGALADESGDAYKAENVIAGDITVDVSELDLDVTGSQAAPASVTFAEGFLDDHEVISDITCSVLVTEDEVAEGTEETELLSEPILDEQIEENAVGFFYHSIPGSGTVMGPAVTIDSKYAGITVDIYAYAKGKEKKDAQKIGSKVIEKTVKTITPSGEATSLEWYHVLNRVDCDLSSLGTGTFYIFGRFNVSTTETADSEPITLTIPGAPKVKEIVKASGKDKYDGSVIFEDEDYGMPLYGRYGHTKDNETTYNAVAKTYTASDLYPGSYEAFIPRASGYTYFTDKFALNSPVTEFFVDVEEPEIKDIEIWDYNRGAKIAKNATKELNKGDSLRVFGKIITDGDPSLLPDTGIVYKSGNPSAVSVDDQGNIKALKAGEEAIISVSTHAVDEDGEPLKSQSIVIKTKDAGKKLKINKAKFKESTIEKDYKANDKFTAVIELDEDAECDVSWMIDDPRVIGIPEGGDYMTEAKSGKAENEFEILNPGKAVITANIGGVKTVSCTVLVSGTADLKASPYFQNGKFLSGFWAFDKDSKTPVESGNKALKSTGNVFIMYFDPATHYPMAGVITVGKKLYLIGDGKELVRGTKDKDGSVEAGYVINKLGELQTGWQKADGAADESYYSPDNGQLAKYEWIPRGKGYTWVNGSGIMADHYGTRLIKYDGAHVIDLSDEESAEYCFKGGLRQTGLFYLDDHGEITKAKNAYAAAYFQVPVGEMVKYSFFTVGGKRYYADKDGMIKLSAAFTVDGYKYYADGTGAILCGGKLFTVDKASFTGDKTATGKVTFYADETGIIARNACMTVNGRIYSFDENGIMDCTSEGKLSGYRYLPEGASEKSELYIKLAKANKPADGTFFYTDAECRNKLTNSWIYIGDDAKASLYADKNGKLASGLYKVGGTTFFFDPERECLVSRDSNDHIIKYKGKLYLCSGEGSVFTKTGEFKKFGSSYVRIKDAAGALMTGIQTIEGKKYVFGKDGILHGSESGFIRDGADYTSYYLANKDYDKSKPETWYINVPGKTMIYGAGEQKFVINKDGSMVVNGWAKVSGKKYYLFMGTMFGPGEILKIGGKYYAFNEDGSMHTGWVKIKEPVIIDVANFNSKEYESGDMYFFCDKKTGAMVTGWKTMKAPKTDEDGNITDDVEKEVTGNSKKIFFNTTWTDDYPACALVRNMDMSVKGTIYRFAGDGSAAAGNEGFVYTNPKAANYDGLKSYVKKDGSFAKGRTKVGDQYFYFNTSDGTKETNVIRKTGKKWYYYGDNGSQSTSLEMYHPLSKRPVIGVFNKDGSIKSFVLQDGLGTVIKNDVVVLHSLTETYILGKNGLPTTGLVGMAKGNNTRIYIESDGRALGTDSTEGLKLKKVGSKYYMFYGSYVLDTYELEYAYSALSAVAAYDDGLGYISIRADKDMFTLLSDSDKALAAQCILYNKAMEGAPLMILLNKDGSVKTGNVSSSHGSFSMNRLGICQDTLSLFVKRGGWKISAMYGKGKAGSEEFMVSDINNTAGGSMYLVIAWDDNGNLLPIVEKATGKKVDGDYSFPGMSKPVFMQVRKGKLAPNKITASEGPFKITLKLDKELGIGVPDLLYL